MPTKTSKATVLILVYVTLRNIIVHLNLACSNKNCFKTIFCNYFTQTQYVFEIKDTTNNCSVFFVPIPLLLNTNKMYAHQCSHFQSQTGNILQYKEFSVCLVSFETIGEALLKLDIIRKSFNIKSLSLEDNLDMCSFAWTLLNCVCLNQSNKN
ncbi:hypothetical protein NQ318_009946, partial [Aromia moschata]